MNEKAKTAVIYARNAARPTSETENDPKFSWNYIPAQIADCKAYAEEKGYSVVGTFFEYGAGSAGVKLPEMQNVIELAKAKEFDVLLFAHFDRLSRDQIRIAILLETFQQAGVETICVHESLEETAEGRFMQQALQFVAEQERQKRRARKSTRKGTEAQNA